MYAYDNAFNYSLLMKLIYSNSEFVSVCVFFVMRLCLYKNILHNVLTFNEYEK